MTRAQRRSQQSGFTLVEALTSIVILVFGLVAVTNLLIVAGNSSTVANAGTAAAAIAVEQMETLKLTPFMTIGATPGLQADGGDLDNNVAGYFRDSTTDPRLRIPGAGTVTVRWSIFRPAQNLVHIQVRAIAGGMLARRTQADFTTFRACTSPIPNNGVCPASANNLCCP